MSVLYLVRHGQASYGAADYDLLSPRGEEQARALGAYWARLGLGFDHCWVGPRARHRQTHELAMAAYRDAGGTLPAATTLSELDEHDGQTLLSQSAAGEAAAATDAAGLREQLRTFRQEMRRWVRGELETPSGLEPWRSFRRRVDAGFERIVADDRRGASIVAFTSGGPIASAVGLALGLGDEAVMELSWWLRNGSVSELRYRAGRGAPPGHHKAGRDKAGGHKAGRFTLIAYNATNHLDRPDLLTHI